MSPTSSVLATAVAVPTPVVAAYLGAALLFILSLGGLAAQGTARWGNRLGVLGMVLALAATFFAAGAPTWGAETWALVGGSVALGTVVGSGLAARVAMTAMPELVAILHSFVGLGAVLVGVANVLQPLPAGAGARWVHLTEVWLGVAIGAITFTGSVIAWGKLNGRLKPQPLLLPGRHLLNLGVGVLLLGGLVPFGLLEGPPQVAVLVGAAVVAGGLGAHLVAAIGGGDMPVVVSLLNSYSGWAAAAAGFLLGNDLLIVTGALVGSSGAILSKIMCDAMNRSIWNVVFGGFGSAASSGSAAVVEGEPVPTDAATVAQELMAARRVVVVPGYGLAVARAQHLAHDLATRLKRRGVEVRYAIHPVAGRLPGHMNVLLAEAGVPYDLVLEMDEIQADLPATDVVLVLGANDIVNPGAETDPGSPIYGMPVLQVWKSQRVVVFKRGKGAGYAGIENPLFVLPATRMLYGDAKATLEQLVAAVG